MTSRWWIPKFASDQSAYQVSELSAEDDKASVASLGPPSEASIEEGEVFYYGQYQEEGALRRRWIENPGEPNCPIQESSLTLTQLQQQLTVEIVQAGPTSRDYNNLFHYLGLAQQTSDHMESQYMNFDLMSTVVSWRGFIGPGVIIIENIHRSTGYMHQISDVTLAFYKSFHDINTLRHVVVDNVVNEDTLDFLYGQLHANIQHSEEWWRTWEYGTPEYEALLGTRMGKTIAYIVLGGLPRGTRRISRISTVFLCAWTGAHFHFEIEAI